LPASASERRWPVRLTASAQDDLDALPSAESAGLVTRLRGLEAEPIPLGKNLKRLHGLKRPVWRLRHGDFRILYRVEGGQVLVVRVVNRRDLDRAVERL
jgi:mRNA-degrading endonuclease RelE of RelBE toxin-antitoxin system